MSDGTWRHLEQWFSTFLHQQTGKQGKKFYGSATYNRNEWTRLSQ